MTEYEAYLITYTKKLRKSYYDDLWNRQTEVWQNAARHFWKETENLPYESIYPTYSRIYNLIVKGGELPAIKDAPTSPTSPESKAKNYLILTAIILVAFLLLFLIKKK